MFQPFSTRVSVPVAPLYSGWRLTPVQAFVTGTKAPCAADVKTAAAQAAFKDKRFISRSS